MSKALRMAQLRRAVQLLLNSVEDEETLQEVATVAPAYAVGREYRAGEVFSWGLNSVGDPQLWRVLQKHTSAEVWAPDQSPSLYKAIGLQGGYPIWAPPTMAEDAYNTGDRCAHLGKVWESLIDGNSTEPGSDDRWWREVG